MLLDHFHGELKLHRDWHGFHNTWATMLAGDLNRRLPAGWYAEPHVQFGVEIDVATLKESLAIRNATENPTTSVAADEWRPPAPALVLDFPLTTDVVRVAVFSPWGARELAAAIEIVSPTNKDRPDSREAFVSKCETDLRDGAGLVVIDVVTQRHANLHEELLERLGHFTDGASAGDLYAAAYRPNADGIHPVLEVWQEPFTVGGPLKSLPMWLKNGPCVMVNLEETYLEACRMIRLPVRSEQA